MQYNLNKSERGQLKWKYDDEEERSSDNDSDNEEYDNNAHRDGDLVDLADEILITKRVAVGFGFMLN